MAAYCEPLNAGLASETGAVCRRVSRLFDALDSEVSAYIVEGQILEDLRDFRYALLTKLEADGWSLSYNGGNRFKVRPPGHKKPFRKHVVA